MVVFDEEKIELLISQCRFAEAVTLLRVSRAEDGSDEVRRRRFLRSIAAITSNDRALGSLVEAAVLSLRTASDMAAYHDTIAGGATYHDQLAAGVVLTWSCDAAGAYRFFRRSHDGALSEKRPHLAVAALERLAAHATLFGEIDLARSTLDESIRLASEHRLAQWQLRCVASAARLAIDAGDPVTAEHLLDFARAKSPANSTAMLFAPIAVQIALERSDDALVRELISSDVTEAALRCSVPEFAIAATLALTVASDTALQGLPAQLALRRASFEARIDPLGVELFAMAAKHGDIIEARLAARALAAARAPARPYVRAHRMLARAQVLARLGKYTASVDAAGDAARAFHSLGLRRWTNEAMLLLVRPERNFLRRGENGGALVRLTEREQQVADLIRRGASNREVADTLQISEHTVERHVSSILGRLGLRSRWQIADALEQR
jgi:ATP/maltotriose-dependent transcriptional regulator MalT